MINVLHIIRYPGLGGAEVLVKNIINSNSTDHFTHFIFYKVDGKLLDQISSEKRKYLIKSNAKEKFFFPLDLRKTIKAFDIKIIHTHQPIDVLYSVIATIGKNVKVIRTYHGFSGLRSDEIRAKQKIINIITNKFVCLNLYVSEILLEHFEFINPNKLQSRQKVLYNGIDLDGLKKKTETNVRKDLNLNDRSLLLGMIGSFNSIGRDQYTICEALKLVLPEYPGIHFVFIGETNESESESYQKCYNFCQNNKLLSNIHFLGERSDISELLNVLDLYVHSSNYETFGLALVEAMACGVPCIASDIPAFREVSDQGSNITTFEKGNVKDLSRILISELHNLKSISTIDRVGRAKRYVQEKFSIQSHLTALHSYYLECLK